MDAAHKTIEIGEDNQRSSHIKVASDKRCNIYSPIYSPTLDISYNAFCAKKTNCTLFRLYRGRVG